MGLRMKVGIDGAEDIERCIPHSSQKPSNTNHKDNVTKSQELILKDLVKVILIARKRVYWSIARAKHPSNSFIVDLIPAVQSNVRGKSIKSFYKSCSLCGLLPTWFTSRIKSSPLPVLLPTKNSITSYLESSWFESEVEFIQWTNCLLICTQIKLWANF